ncbi:hypothetical protein CY35_04G043600 [Sphagnum magellanicum]|jgi:hypothetical protein|nr:hypothetical protein CY35_04G043600 [Sphagnum magellanicum]
MASISVSSFASLAAPVTAAVAAAAAPGSSGSGKRGGSNKMRQVRRLKAFGGLRTESGLGVSQCSTEQAFAATMRAQCFAGRVVAGRARGGAATSTCDVASEIFTVVPIMSGLVLIGVALGFVLLRVEAAVEESE